ncbi:unnamed protein product, partial [Prorocentrum cordatum]
EYPGNDPQTLEFPAASAATDGPAREWREVVQLCHEEQIADFATRGPRTAARCAKYQVREGGPSLHRDMWRGHRKRTSTDYGVDTHEALSRTFEAMGVSGHLDIFNLASGEIGHRALQLIGRYWDDRSAEQQHNYRKIPLEGAQAFMGGARSPLTVRPELRETVSRELKRMYSIKKNARKLREEQAAAPMAEPAPPKGSRCCGRRLDGLGPAAELQRVPDWRGAPGGPARARSARRRRGHRALRGELLTELVVALNQLDAGSDLVRRQCEGEPSRMQQLCLERLAESCAAMGAPPSDMSTEVAFRELQVSTAYGDCDPVTAAPFARDLVSLPAVGGAPVPLDQLLGKGGPEIVRRFIATKVLSNQDAVEAKRDSGFARPYLDPVLRRREDYLSFIRRMGAAD